MMYFITIVQIMSRTASPSTWRKMRLEPLLQADHDVRVRDKQQLDQSLLFSVLAAALAWACAPRTAERNARAAEGTATLPISAARVVTLRPYMARVESSSWITSAPSSVRPANAPLARE